LHVSVQASSLLSVRLPSVSRAAAAGCHQQVGFKDRQNQKGDCHGPSHAFSVL
jgi:hypothetical protein